MLLFLKILFACSLEKNTTQFTHSLLNIYIFTKLDFFLEFACPIFSYLKIEYTFFLYLKRRDFLCYKQFSKKKLMAEFVDVKQFHGFMQAILMFGRCYKRLNLSMEFWTQSSFFKAYRLWGCIQYKSSYYVSSILSYLFVLRCKKAKTFQEIYPLNWSVLPREPFVEIRAPREPPCILHLKTESLFKNRY